MYENSISKPSHALAVSKIAVLKVSALVWLWLFLALQNTSASWFSVIWLTLYSAINSAMSGKNSARSVVNLAWLSALARSSRLVWLAALYAIVPLFMPLIPIVGMPSEQRAKALNSPSVITLFVPLSALNVLFYRCETVLLNK
jgi:hypothetical protein